MKSDRGREKHCGKNSAHDQRRILSAQLVLDFGDHGKPSYITTKSCVIGVLE